MGTFATDLKEVGRTRGPTIVGSDWLSTRLHHEVNFSCKRVEKSVRLLARSNSKTNKTVITNKFVRKP